MNSEFFALLHLNSFFVKTSEKVHISYEMARLLANDKIGHQLDVFIEVTIDET